MQLVDRLWLGNRTIWHLGSLGWRPAWKEARRWLLGRKLSTNSRRACSWSTCNCRIRYSWLPKGSDDPFSVCICCTMNNDDSDQAIFRSSEKDKSYLSSETPLTHSYATVLFPLKRVHDLFLFLFTSSLFSLSMLIHQFLLLFIIVRSINFSGIRF